MQHTVESIKILLATNDRAIGRALMVLRNRQTADEQRSERTKYLNGRGFRPCHARMGTSMADFFQRRGYLTEKQIAYWRVKMADGNSRIEIYARQLLEEAAIKAAAKMDLQREEVAERDMQHMEADGDRRQTIREEMAKYRARREMETV